MKFKTTQFFNIKKLRLSQHFSNPLKEDAKHRFSRSASSVSTLAFTNPDASMAPLQCHTEAHCVICLNALEQQANIASTTATAITTTTATTTAATATTTATTATQLTQQQQQHKHHKRHYSQQLSIPESAHIAGCSSESCKNLVSLGQQKALSKSLRNATSTSNLGTTSASAASLNSVSPTRKNGNNTAKHEQLSSAAATTAAAAAAAPSTEKEKKRKEVSSSRVKKFHRHFGQLPKEEKLINYFSCALVSDILLQGHLYITEQHFAFYSNVFGYVTKVVIPTSSVTKISKEKTAKIIPNAVGVATADERHVFGSFISREAAFRLMCSVCLPLAPVEIIAKVPADIEISEEYSIEDESSCSISGNESSPQAREATGGAAGSVAIASALLNDEANPMLLRRSVGASSLNIADGKRTANADQKKQRHSDIPLHAKLSTASSSSASNAAQQQQQNGAAACTLIPPTVHYNNNNNNNTNNNKNQKKHSSNPTSNLSVDADLAMKHAASALLLNHNNTSSSASPTASMNGMTTKNVAMIIAGTASSSTSSVTSTPSTSSSPTTVVATKRNCSNSKTTAARTLFKRALLRIKFPTELHVVYLGVLLSVILALLSVFLLYRILDIEAKTSLYRATPTEFLWRSDSDDDIFAEALRWQKELQTKSAQEAQTILQTNLDQIAKVRRSLETLSMLIYDRSAVYDENGSAAAAAAAAATTANSVDSD